jgi:hypothetical protein
MDDDNMTKAMEPKQENIQETKSSTLNKKCNKEAEATLIRSLTIAGQLA